MTKHCLELKDGQRWRDPWYASGYTYEIYKLKNGHWLCITDRNHVARWAGNTVPYVDGEVLKKHMAGWVLIKCNLCNDSGHYVQKNPSEPLGRCACSL